MIVFFGISLICILIASFQKRSKYALSVAFLVLTVFLSIRYDYGNDYSTYLLHFNNINQGSLDLALNFESFETGWVLLCRICKPIGFFGMVIILTFIENTIVYYMIKKHVPQEWYWLAMFCYLFTNSLCLTGLSMMRQFLAMCICLLAFDYVVRKKIIVSLLLVLLAGQFHTSAFVCAPFCLIGLLKDIKLSFFSTIIIIIALAILNYFAISAFGDFLINMVNNSVFDTYEDYIGRENNTIIGISDVFNYFLIGVILFLQNKQDLSNRLFTFLLLPFVIIEMFIPIMPLVGRLGLYFYLLFPICMTNAIGKLRVHWQMGLIILLFLFRLYGYFSFVQSTGWGSSFLTYKTIFSVGEWM